MTAMTAKDAIDLVRREVAESIRVKDRWSDELCAAIASLADRAASALREGGKVVLFGNGGSAADAQHIAAELMGRYLRERGPLQAMALHTDTSAVTAIGNDYGYDLVFERQVRAWVRKGDIAIGISTSGNSKNVILGLQKAKAQGAFTAALTGEGGGGCAKACDLLLAVPSKATPRIQESHITIGHIFCALVEQQLA
jgi:D-sedoheptulose 7-phosphate isomerase